MQALELRDNALQWETERQNRLLQSAAEQRKKQTRLEAVQRQQTPEAKSEAAASIRLDEWVDKVNAIPDIRSALVPLDDEEGWSKPFSLAKADLEPWLSYFRGYRQSRLFLAHAVHDAASPDAASIDYPVRALLELRRADARIITEPPVQINGQVDYFDTEAVIAAGHEASEFRASLRGAILNHDKQLKLAEEKGREMGDALHEALMGEGHANLIGAWEKVFKRKPNIDELHQMLTSGRVRVSAEKKQIITETRPPVPEMPAAAPVLRPSPEKRPVMPPPEPSQASVPATEDDDDEAVVTLSTYAKKEAPARKFLWPAIHAAIGCAALAAYIFVF
ncbi:hypothetical protein [Noviherbaspirillum sp.]|uniref:hypothetical protein n=1 Tax=Noviherbaspirillum sp. TaxID=1926288 RepID=UPI002D66080D|nr:hypothetical protein [Noviherbaspirillum sp.]HZW20627.1 hypothetical protein [Noviherbaspirillum sp.]